MNNAFKYPRRSNQGGVALLIAIFALLLISGVAISLLVMSGTESAINANYRGSTQAFYAAYSGLEEARGRISRTHPNTIMGVLVPRFPTKLLVGQIRYIRNPSPPGEVVDPFNQAATNPYRDNEYRIECLGAGGTCVDPVAGSTQFGTSISGALIPGVPGPLFKWVRITPKTERSSQINLNNDALPLNGVIPIYYDNTKQNLTSTGRQVYSITSLAVLPGGSRRMLQYTVAPATPLPITAALFTRLSAQTGSTINVIGNSEQACSVPGVYGVESGSTITVPGGSGGNFQGSPSGTQQNAPFSYDIPKLFAMLTPGATPIDAAGTGVTGSGSPVSYTGANAVLGVAPTTNPVIPPPNQLSTYSGGVPVTYHSQGNLTLGSAATAGTPPIGHGMLLVEGDLTIDISHGFYYYGLILVTGNIRIIAGGGSTRGLDIHGAIIGGGTFNATAISGMNGNNLSVGIQQDTCIVIDQLDRLPVTVLSFREISQ